MRWEKLQMGPAYGPGKMWGHTCTAIRGGKFLYVFGGYGKDNSQTNQVHVFDTATRTWSDPVMKGTPPVPRDSHSCTAIGDNLFVFGGTDGQNPLNDLHILDTSTHTWISPSVRGEGPEAREGHSAAVVGRRLFIFGGCGKSSNNSDEEFYDDLYILNTETFVWKRAATLGCPPAKRDSHTCSSWKNKIIIIGGEDSYDYYLSDVHILDADTLVWSKLFTSGQLLPPRAGHTTVALGKNLFVFGGFTDESNLYDDLYMLDIETGVWTQVMATGNGPCARFSMAGDSLDPQKSGILVFLGGCSKNLEALDDMFYLHTGLTTENERDERRLEKLSLRKQLKLKCQEQNMLTPPAYDKALVRIETNADLYQPIPMPSIEPSKPHIYSREYQPFPRKRTFQAKVTKCFPVGYTIETIIDGKILHGVLFSNKLSFNHIDDNSKRRKGAVEIDGVKLKDNQKSKSEIDSVHGKNTEAAAATANTKSPAPSDASQPHEDAGNLKVPVVADINVEDNETGNAPNSSMEVHKENPSSADKDYHFVPNPRGQSIDC
ncbi:Kelch domain-containing protein 3 [Camellia lanceoleosa]|uniref:Kelch domain-containing protein 3 n=1 Tax=Camellia lanceoleosa TaxID=1840588 RepID=A0ACC0FAP7_9ERIC|nr:Kelch domain-containing protein 3 [Camellia lanceoleosa]